MAPRVGHPNATSKEQEAQGQAPEGMPKGEPRKAAMLRVGLCPWLRESWARGRSNRHAHILTIQVIKAFTRIVTAIL